ncbi:MAG: PA0069 family radical SAM protein [Verrucomicrobiales bacterium]|nr:PA0069 family radical SAM protein [Verrucomicrobiales bacterium]
MATEPAGAGWRGRGAAINRAGRFESLSIDYDPGEEPGRVRTQFLKDDSQSIISRHDSPDLPFEASLNPYRGCEHGCAYCYARPTHEFLGFSAGVDFESRILVKHRAAELLEAELRRANYQPKVLSLSGVTDPYQPVERELRITRSCLEVLAAFRHPVGMITKNHLITRDVDLLAELATHQAAVAYISITTLDADLARELEPRASTPRARLEAISVLAAAGVPVGVSVAPMIPGLNDSEIPAILTAAAEAGATFAGYTVVRLPFGVKDVFAAWLDRHRPGMREKILGRIAETQGATLSHGDFGTRLRGQGIWAEQIRSLFQVSRNRCGMLLRRPEVSTGAFRCPGGDGELFDWGGLER